MKNLLCPGCGVIGGPPLVAGAACTCGKAFEDIDPDILKALQPFAPVDAGYWKTIGMLMLGAAVIGAVNMRSIRRS